MTNNTTPFGTLHQAQLQAHPTLDSSLDFPAFMPTGPQYDHTDGPSSGATSSGDSQFGFPTRHASGSELAASPASSYAPSLTDGRNNSISYAQPPFKIPSAVVNQDRRTSSPAVIARHGQPMLINSAYHPSPSTQSEMHASHWTPNFSFGGPDAHHEMPSQPYSEPFSAQEQYILPPGISNARRGSHSYGMVQDLPSQYSFDRRMSHPVLPTGSFDSTQQMPRHRQASAIDWRSYASSNALRPGQGDFSNGFQGSDGLWNTLDSARGMVAMSNQNDPALEQYQQKMTLRRQSMPFLHGATTSIDEDQELDQHDNSGLYGTQHRLSTSTEEGSIVALQPSMGSDGNPDQASMMNTFSAKDTNSGHKKHICPVCKKRFTRPSSLTTHIYSHTGEKPFICEIDGCGRHFSVISNLRRHKKTHGQSSANDDLDNKLDGAEMQPASLSIS